VRLLRLTALLLLLFCGLALAGPVFAEPVVAIDVDPSVEGMQIEIEVIEGDAVAIDIWVLGIDTSEPLHAFELDLIFDDFVLTAQIIEEGDFLGDEIVTVVEEIGGDTVIIAYARIGEEGSEGSGIVASVIFMADGVGSSMLQFDSVILTTLDDGTVLEIAPFGTEGATIIVPEPGAVRLGLAAMAVVGCLGWHRRRRDREGVLA